MMIKGMKTEMLHFWSAFLVCISDLHFWSGFLACISGSSAPPEYKLLQSRQYLSGAALEAIENLRFSRAACQTEKGQARANISVVEGESHFIWTIRVILHQ